MKENQANLWTEIVKKLTEMNLTKIGRAHV